MKELIESIERYGFECEAGRLEDCLEWQELKRKVLGAEPEEEAPVTGEIDQFGELVSATPAFINPQLPGAPK